MLRLTAAENVVFRALLRAANAVVYRVVANEERGGVGRQRPHWKELRRCTRPLILLTVLP